MKIINNYFISHSLSFLIRPDTDDSDIKGKNLIYEANVQKQKSVPQKLNSSKNLSSQKDSDSVSCKNNQEHFDQYFVTG